jgi:hypothetical protein
VRSPTVRWYSVSFTNDTRKLASTATIPCRSEGGADVVIISDAILSSLALIAKQSDPRRPVIFENHLHVYHDSKHNGVDRRQTENQTFAFLRARVREVDLLVSQEPKAFAPPLMPMKQVGYMPVAADQYGRLSDCAVLNCVN